MMAIILERLRVMGVTIPCLVLKRYTGAILINTTTICIIIELMKITKNGEV